MKLHERALAAGVYQPEGMHAEALHHPEAARQCPIRHQPHDRVQRLRLQRHEVPQGVVRRLRLRDLVVRLRLDRMNEVGELDAVLDEEDGKVVAYQVVVALVGVELRREPADITNGVSRAAGPGDRGEPHEHRCLFARRGQELRDGVVGQRIVVGLEVSVGARTAGVYHPFGDALVVEVGDLLPRVEVLQQRRPALSDAQRVVGVIHANTLLRGQIPARAVDPILV